MTRLSLDLLGTFAATLDGRAVSRFRSNKARALLAFLAVESARPHSRASLAALLWPEYSDQEAFRNLRVTMHRLRRALDDTAAGAGDQILQTIGSQVQINRNGLTLDMTVFTGHLEEVSAHGHSLPNLCPDCLERLEQAVALYQGELLAGFELRGAPPFEEWLFVERERLWRQCLWAVSSLAAAYEQLGELDRALDHAARELALDSYREEAYRRMMRLLALSDRRSEAIACYLNCRRVLGDELGIEPDDETTALVERIRIGDLTQSQRAPIRLVNFPTLFTSLVGREAELRAIRERLLDPGCRLLTLTGLGGAGKTRLAIEAARQIAAEPDSAGGRFTDGVFFIALASVDSPDHLPATLAGSLGVTPHPGATVFDQVIDFLRHKQMLLVLDNLEKFRQDTIWLLAILEAASAVEMLVTSRFPLELHAEERLAVSGLGVPPATSTTDEAMTFPAVQLFVQAARRVQHDFQLLPSDVPAVARICQFVDGRPLALEIAASWLRIYDCAEIAREIARSFEFLATNLRDVPARHRSVRIVFDHTWDLLSPAQQQALANLTVFRGPFKLEAGLAVADTSVVDMVALLDAALVQRRANGWYELHELLRQFAAQQLQDPSSSDGQAAHAGGRHSEYYLTYLAARESDLLGQKPQIAISQIRRRLDDIRAAWRWAGDQGWLSGLEQGLEGLALFYDLTGLFDEAIRMLDWTAMRLHELDEKAISSGRAVGLLSRLLAWRAHFLNRSGQGNEAIDLLLQALTFAQQSGEPRDQADVLSLLGEMLPHRGEFDRAQQHQQDAISFYRSVADKRRLAVALTRLGVTHWRRGSYGDALACFQEALALQEGLQNRLGTARILWSMGGIAFEQRRHAEALSHAQEARDIYEAIGDRWGMATLAGNLALLSQAQGDYQTALEFNRQDLDYDIETGNRHGEAVALGNRGGIFLDAGRLDEALECFQRAVSIQEELDNRWEVARHQASIADIWARRDKPHLALAEYQRAIPVLRDHGARFYLIDPLLEAAHLLVDQGELAAARELAREGGPLATELAIEDRLVQYQILEARLLHAAGDTQHAMEQLHALEEQTAGPEGLAFGRYWRWKFGRNEADRNAAEELYKEMYRRLPKYDYKVRLEELQELAP